MPKIKGTHTAMKSGMTAAETLFPRLKAGTAAGAEIAEYPEALKKTWLWDELYRVRNIRPSFHGGMMAGLVYSALDTYLFRGKAPWTLHNHPDHTQLRKASDMPKIAYPKPDGVVTLRPAVVSIPVGDQPRRKPAGAPDAEEQGRADRHQPGAV